MNSRLEDAISSMNSEQLWALKVCIMAERRLQTDNTALTVGPNMKSRMRQAYDWALKSDEDLKNLVPERP